MTDRMSVLIWIYTVYTPIVFLKEVYYEKSQKTTTISEKLPSMQRACVQVIASLFEIPPFKEFVSLQLWSWPDGQFT